MEPVTWINCFEVPEGQEDEFFAHWKGVAVEHFRTKPGFIDFRMYRAHSWPGRFAFVNVTHWESVEHIHAAHDDDFREILATMPVRAQAHPGVFEVVAEG